MLSLWYFQNCLEASLPATRWRTAGSQPTNYAYLLGTLTLLSSRMIVLKLGQVVDILVDNDVEVVGFVVGGHIGSGETL
jgi:sulfur carrier protein ThiS